MLKKYESLASPERHISRFETIGFLFNLNSKKVTESKVLELACGTGRNLIPQAIQYPNSRFIGIDIDKEAIEIANKNVAELNLKNIEFKVASIEAYSKEEIAFDYIICHGTYSWVEKTVRIKILELIEKLLAKNGISYLSFNCLPGWFERSKIKEALKEIKEVELAKEKINEIITDKNSSDPLKKEANFCLKQSDQFILQELLNKDATGFHYLQFKKEVNKNNLYLLFDSKPSRNRYYRLEETIQLNEALKDEDLSKLGRFDKEQQMDELIPLSFRGALLTKENKEEEALDISKFKDCYLSSPLLPKEEKLEIYNDFPELFIGPNESSAEIDKPFFKAFFLSFRHVWPNSLSFSEVFSMAKDLSGEEVEKNKVYEEINKFFHFGLIEVTKDKPVFPKKTLEVFKSVKLYAQKSNWVTTVRHEYFPVDEIDRYLLTCLNGKNTIKEILNLLYEHIKPSVVNEDKDKVLELLNSQLKEKLKVYCEQGLILI